MPLLLIVVLGLVLFLVRQRQQKSKPATIESETVNRDRGFDRRVTYLEYSNHAKCRMQCRQISQSEVQSIMQDGKINYKKSDLKNVRCPRYALEGNTTDGQQVRIVYAQCNEKTVVVTVIDLEKEWSCDCPGDN